MGKDTQSTNLIEGEKLYLQHKGKDLDGCTEHFQLHDTALKSKNYKLSYRDKFFREAFSPMHLMNFKLFNNMLDQFTAWCECQDLYTKEDEEFDPELIPLDMFIEFFTEDRYHLKQIFNHESPMRSVLDFGGLFVRTKQKNQLFDESDEENISGVIEEVFRDSLLSANSMNFLSDDMQNTFIRESIKASIKIEKDPEVEVKTPRRRDLKSIDIFSLRVLSLIVCRGRPTQKASFLTAMANKSLNAPVHYENKRMKRALRLLLYFTSVLPNKFMSVNRDSDVFNKILGTEKYSKTKRGKRIAIEAFDFEEGFMWTEKDIEMNEKLFEDVYDVFYEERYIDKIFGKQVNICHDDFIKNFNTGKNYLGLSQKIHEQPDNRILDWFFSPKRANNVYNKLMSNSNTVECFNIEKIDFTNELNDLIEINYDENDDDDTAISFGNSDSSTPVPFS